MPTLSVPQNAGTFIIAMTVVVGSFAFFIFRGADPVITPILAGSMGVVLSYFFAQHISNGSATAALNTLIQTRAATGTSIDAVVDSKTTPKP